MNDNNDTPTPEKPHIPGPPKMSPMQSRSMGQQPQQIGNPIPPRTEPDEHFHAIEGEGFSAVLSHLLKKPMSVIYEIKNGTQSPLPSLAIITLVCLSIFGLVLGLFSAGEQLWAAPVKVVGGVFFSALICLPSLYIFGSLGGMNAGIQHFTGLILTLLSITSLLLVGFAPVVWLFSTSSNSLVFFGFLSLAIWLVCLMFAMRIISQASLCLGGKAGGHLHVWATIFILVTLQMTTSLRPIIGSSDDILNLKEKKFFIMHWVDNMNDRTEAGRDETSYETPPSDSDAGKPAKNR